MRPDRFRWRSSFWLALAAGLALAGCLAPTPTDGSKAAARAARSTAGNEDAARHFSGDALALARAAERGDAAAIAAFIGKTASGKTASANTTLDPDTLFSRRDGLPLIAWPVRTGQLDGLRTLLEHGADPDARRPERIEQRQPDGSGGLRYTHDNALVLAARLEDPRFLRLLLEHGGDPNTQSVAGEPLTLVAFLAGNRWENVQLLIERGADIDAETWSGPPIQWYSGRGAFRQVFWLLERGADVHVRTQGFQPAPRDAEGRYLPQPQMPKDGHTWLLYDAQGKPVPVVRDTVIDDIYWHPGTPDAPEWQRKCQQWLQARGIARPSMPDHLREMRRTFGLPHEEAEIPLL